MKPSTTLYVRGTVLAAVTLALPWLARVSAEMLERDRDKIASTFDRFTFAASELVVAILGVLPALTFVGLLYCLLQGSFLLFQERKREAQSSVPSL